MHPTELGQKYDKIASWWHAHHENSSYGVAQVQRALRFAVSGGTALDVGCGAGGRIISALESEQLAVTGIDVSTEMLGLARLHHPEHTFIQADISQWQDNKTYGFIVAWDSLFHLPIERQAPTLNKLCQCLAPSGVMIYTFGDGTGEHTDTWRNDTFYYSSIGIEENHRILKENGLTLLHLELDQFPEKHVYVIAMRR